MMPWGDDFSYMSANATFWSSDNLIDYFNRKYQNVTVFYSTPYMYLDALKA